MLEEITGVITSSRNINTKKRSSIITTNRIKTAVTTALVAAFVVMGFTAKATVINVDPLNPQGWFADDNRLDGTSAITPLYTRGAPGSLQMTITNSTDKATQALYWNANTGNPFGVVTTLGNLNAFSFEFYKSGLSTIAGIQAPALRLYFLNDTNNNGIRDAGESWGSLVWERPYNEDGNTPTDQWLSADLTIDKLWMRNSTSGQNLDVAGGFLTLQQWLDPNVTKPNGALSLTSSTKIFGMETSIGSGIPGFESVGVDNIGMGYHDGNYNQYDFTDAVPEPTTYASVMVGFGLLGAYFVKRRKAVRSS